MMWWTTELSPGKVFSKFYLFTRRSYFSFRAFHVDVSLFPRRNILPFSFWLAWRRQHWKRTNIKVSSSTSFNDGRTGDQCLTSCPLCLLSLLLFLSSPFPFTFSIQHLSSSQFTSQFSSTCSSSQKQADHSLTLPFGHFITSCLAYFLFFNTSNFPSF